MTANGTRVPALGQAPVRGGSGPGLWELVVSVSRTGSRRYRRNRKAVLALSDVCWICGKPGADTADHVRAHALGGGDEADNLRPAHRSCNAARGIGRRDRFRTERTSRSW